MKNKKALNVIGALFATALILPLSSSAKEASGTLDFEQTILGKSLTVTKVANIKLEDAVEGAAATTGKGSFALAGSNVGGLTVSLATDFGSAEWITTVTPPTSATLDASGNATVDVNVTTVPDKLAIGKNEATLTLTATY